MGIQRGWVIPAASPGECIRACQPVTKGQLREVEGAVMPGGTCVICGARLRPWWMPPEIYQQLEGYYWGCDECERVYRKLTSDEVKEMEGVKL